MTPTSRNRKITWQLPGSSARRRISMTRVRRPVLGTDRRDVCPARAVLRAVPPGPARAGVDEHSLARRDGAGTQPGQAELRDRQAQADDRARRVPVHYRARLGEVDVPALVVVTDEFGLDRAAN